MRNTVTRWAQNPHGRHDDGESVATHRVRGGFTVDVGNHLLCHILLLDTIQTSTFGQILETEFSARSGAPSSPVLCSFT